jgi:hypothetical protein
MKIELGGESFNLESLSLNDWVKLEDLGVDITKFNKGISPSMKDIRALMFIAISKVSEKTIEWVGDNIDPMNDAELFKQVINFIAAKESSQVENT